MKEELKLIHTNECEANNKARTLESEKQELAKLLENKISILDSSNGNDF